MAEFDKNQDKGDINRSEQGEKPAFGQFDKERGQQGQQEFGETTGEDLDEDQQQQGQAKQEFAGAGRQQGDNQFKDEKRGEDDRDI